METENLVNIFDLLNKRDEEFQDGFNDFISSFSFLEKDYLMKLISDFEVKENEEIGDVIDELTTFVNKKLYSTFKSTNNGEIVTLFLNKYLKQNPDFLDIIDRFLLDNNVILNKDDVTIILRNTTILSYYKRILDKKTNVNIDTYTKYFSSSFAGLLFTVYCNMHDIMVDEKIKNSKTLTPEEEKEIFIRLNNGEDVRDEIVLRNQGLVRSIAVRYAAYGELEDLIQDGFLGLFKAIDGFDYKRGNKFSTYATWWIKQSIMRAIADKGRTIRIPVHTNEQILKYKRTKQDLTTKLGYEPSVSDISKVMGVSESQINDLERFNMDTVSLNAPVNDDSDDSTLEMFFGVDDSSAIDEEINNQDLKTGIKLALNTLTDKERAIIIKRFGLETGTPRTLEDVGNEYHVTRERIRQIEDKALRKLRKPSVAAYTRAFLDGNDNENAKIHINEITNIFNILKVKNSNSFNLFIQMLNRDELIALNKTFNANHIPKRCSRLTPGENQCLLNVIALFNQLKNFLNNDLYLELLGFLSTNQNKVNLYNYLNFNDKYVLETVLNDLPINYRKDVVRFFNLNTGELRTSIYRYDFIKVVGAVSEINYAFAQRKLPKEIYDKADPKHYSIYDILKTDDKNVIINAINKLDVADQPIIYKFFGLYFNTKITEQTYLDNFSLFNRLRLFLDIKGDDGNGKCL